MTKKRIINAFIFALAALAFAAAFNIHAAPQGAEVVSGTIEISQPDNALTVISQQSEKGIIDWQSFNIAEGEHTHFQQPGTSAITLNRVVGGDLSTIFGQLTATGQIMLINRAGILFGPSARVDVAGLIATTADISNANFLAGNYVFKEPVGFNSTIVNQGNIKIADHGLVALVAPGVGNSGVIEARFGKVLLGSLPQGAEYALDIYGDNLINFAISANLSQAVPGLGGVSNSGTIVADGGKVLLTANAVKDLVGNVVNVSGVIQANTIASRNGEIILLGSGKGIVRVNGSLVARGQNAGETGGKVVVTGDKVGLFAGTSIDVSGQAGGGTALIGGEYLGAVPMPNLPVANATYVDMEAEILANALDSAAGGRVIVWGSDSARVYGSIEAKGGPKGGAGGFVETSSHYLDINGIRVDLSAPQGITGTWLLDPYNVTISTGTDTNGSYSGASPNIWTASGDSSIVNVATLVTNLQSASVNITTGSGGSQLGNIYIDTVTGDWSSWTSGNSLALLAYNDIIFNAAKGISKSSGAGNLTLRADSEGRYTNGTFFGNVTFNTDSFVNFAGSSGNVYRYFNLADYGGTLPTTNVTMGTGTHTGYILVNDVGASSGRTSGLQYIGNNATTRSRNYALGRDIEANDTATWNSNAGFLPIGNSTSAFNGSFNGSNHTIANLTINRTTEYVGLFGFVENGTIQNVGLINPYIRLNSTSSFRGGVLIGEAGGSLTTVTNVYTQGGNITGGNGGIGGLIGHFEDNAIISDSYNNGTTVSGIFNVGGIIGSVGASGARLSNVTNYGNVTASATDFTGAGGVLGAVALSGGSVNITDATNYGTITGAGNYIGGVVGYQPAGTPILNITSAYNSGNVTSTKATAIGIGGILGYSPNATITNASNFGTISADGNTIGGIAGYAYAVSNSYNAGNIVVNGTSPHFYIAGLVGLADSAINNTYNTGNITVSGATGSNNTTNISGLVGYTASTVNNSYSSGFVNISGGVQTNLGPLVGSALGGAGSVTNSYWDNQTTNYTSSTYGTPNTTANLKINTTYSGWNFSSPGIWYMVNGSTRPMLQMEYSTTLRTPHQLQLIRMNATTLGADYTLANDINLSATGNNAGEIWGTNASGGAGFVPVGAFDPNYFSGTFDGANYTISNLTINRSGSDYQGFFGYLENATVSNVRLANISVSGNNFVGAFAGYINNSAIINNSYATGNVTGAGSQIGGLVGESWESTLNNTHFNGTVSGTDAGNNSDYVGGLVGLLNAHSFINNSYANATVDSNDANYLGGLVGYAINVSNISNSYAVGAVTGSSIYAGGLVGEVDNSVISNSYATGAVSGERSVGGLVGATSNLTVSGSYATGNVTGTGTRVGGLVGELSESNVSNSYATGRVVSSSSSVGGLIGETYDSSLSNSYAIGQVSGASDVGGLVGLDTFSTTVSNSYWDVGTSGQTTSAGGTGLNTTQMMNQSNFSGWNFSSIWSIVADKSYPYLEWRYQTAPTVVSGTSSAGANATVRLAVNGSNTLNLTTYNNGFYYALYDSTEFNPANGSGILVYLPGSTKGSAATAYNSGSQLAWLNITSNTLSVYDATGAGTSSAQLATAAGSLTNSDILYTASGNDITTYSNTPLVTYGTFNISGNITTGTGVQNYTGAVNLAANAVLNGSGITFAGAVNGAYNLTLNSSTGAITFSNSVGNSAALGTILLSSSGGITFANALDAATLNLSGVTAGTVALQGNATLTTLTTGTENYNLELTGVSNTITNAATFSNTGSLTLGNNSSSVNTFTGGIIATAPSSVELAGTLNATNNEVRLGVTNLTGNTTINSGSGTINLTNTVNGGSALTLNSSGTTVIGGTIGGNTALTSLTSQGGGTTNLTANVKTSGSQTYNDNVNLAADAVLNASGITFAGTVNGAYNLTLNASSGAITFDNNVGASSALASFNVTAATISLHDVTTTGGQQYNGSVTTHSTYTTSGASFTVNGSTTLAADTTIRTSGGTISLLGVVDGAYVLTLNSSSGNITFSSNVASASVPLNGLVIESAHDFINLGALYTADFVQSAGTNTYLSGNVTPTGNNSTAFVNVGSGGADIVTNRLTGTIYAPRLNLTVATSPLSADIYGISSSNVSAVGMTLSSGIVLVNGIDFYATSETQSIANIVTAPVLAATDVVTADTSSGGTLSSASDTTSTETSSTATTSTGSNVTTTSESTSTASSGDTSGTTTTTGTETTSSAGTVGATNVTSAETTSGTAAATTTSSGAVSAEGTVTTAAPVTPSAPIAEKIEVVASAPQAVVAQSIDASGKVQQVEIKTGTAFMPDGSVADISKLAATDVIRVGLVSMVDPGRAMSDADNIEQAERAVAMSQDMAKELGIPVVVGGTAGTAQDVAQLLINKKVDFTTTELDQNLGQAQDILFTKPSTVQHQAVLVDRVWLDKAAGATNNQFSVYGLIGIAVAEAAGIDIARDDGTTKDFKQRLNQPNVHIGVVRGTPYQREALEEFPQAQIDVYDSHIEVLQAVNSGKVQAVLQNDEQGRDDFASRPALGLRMESVVLMDNVETRALAAAPNEWTMWQWMNQYVEVRGNKFGFLKQQ